VCVCVMGKVDRGKVAGKTDPADAVDELSGSGEPIAPEINHLSRQIIGAAIEVHRHLGPGLLESIYEQALVHELGLRGMIVQRQVPVTVHYKGLEIDGQRLDLLVEPGIVVELKTVDQLLPIHEAQLLSYLKSTGMRLGLLINFKSRLLKNGVRRIIN
jgi:GxxExxY protein